MLGGTADGVFTSKQEQQRRLCLMDDGKSFRSYQMLGSISDGVFFRRRGNANDADDALWAIVNRSEVIRC